MFAVTLGCTPAAVEDTSQPVTTPTTIISLTFDDTLPDQYQVGDMADARGMHVTFYINSGRVNLAGYMTQGQLLTLQQEGHELAGHTVSHADLPTLDVDEETRQICNDRVALLQYGFSVANFAYPFGDANAQTEQITAACGYNSGRGVGDLVVPNGCDGCAYANPIPPLDAYKLKTPDSIKIDTTLDVLEGYVTQAENNGGGWVPLVFHHVCDGCDSLSVSPATLNAFLDWLAARNANGTVVKTIGEVIGGSLQPGVNGPPPPPPHAGANMIQNPSLELDSNADGIPDCWQHGGSGSNTATYTLVGNAADGAVAQEIDITSFSSGARRLVTRQDLGTCAPPAFPGHTYTVGAQYISNTPPRYTIYYRTTTGGWIFFAQSPTLPTSSTYVTGTYTTPPLPTGATALSVGLSIYDVGSITTDAYSLVDTDVTPPTVALTTPTGSTVGGTVTLTATASDAGGISHVDFLVQGVVVGTATTAPYSVAWDTTKTADSTVGVVARAVDLAGNVSLSPGILVTIANTPPPDTTPPTVAMAVPADGAVVTGLVTVRANATDNVKVSHVDYLVDNQLVASADASPFTAVWDSTKHAAGDAAVTARARDAAGNTTVSAPIHVTVDLAPPAVAITTPLPGAHVSGTVAVTANASDDIGVASVELFVNNSSLGVVTAAPYTVMFDTTSALNGSVKLTATATDRSGQKTTSAPVGVTVHNGGTADTTPPVSTITCNGGACGAGYANHPVTIALSATDAGSGVQSITYALNGGAAQLYNGPFAVGVTTTISFYAVDKASNVEAPHVQTVNVDTIAPATTVTCNGAPCATSFYGGPVTVALAATDTGSGVATIQYSLGGATLTYAGPFVVSSSATLTVQAVDVAGNTEAAQTHPIQIDAAVPTISIFCNGAACPSTPVHGPIAITLLASTTGTSGIAAIHYTLDGSTPTLANGLTYTQPFVVNSTTSTTITVRFAAFSGAGTSSVVGIQSLSYDTVPPTAAIASPTGGNVTGITPIVANVSDDVGVVRVRFYLDGVQLGTRTVTPFRWNWDTSTTTKGVHQLAVQAEDAAGNATRSASVTVTVY
jgi:peptidoglycan/xylan/chitin deacetylase (PgdA/CDA1 family)